MLFFQFINTRYVHELIILSTNKFFDKWDEIMADDAAATLDQFLQYHVGL